MRKLQLPTWLPALLLGLLLLLLAILQFRWIGEVSRAERLRLRTTLEGSVALASRDFDRELNFLLLAFTPARAEDLPSAVERWRENSGDYDLLNSVLRLDMASMLRRSLTRERPTLEVFNQESAQFEPSEWTIELRPVLRFLTRERRSADGLRDGFGDIEPTVPAIIARFPPERRVPPNQQRRSLLILTLRKEALARIATEKLFPQLERALGADFAFRVLDHDDNVVAASTGTEEDWSEAQNTYRSRLLRLRPPGDLGPEFAERVEDRYREIGLTAPPWLREERSQRSPSEADPSSTRPAAWTLEVVHRSGNLEIAVTRARWRNLGISASILALLALAAFYLLRAADRDRRLAESQLDFVAGLTHELHTPLAAIKSAGANLADGVVADPERVREYGAMLQKEGSRLGDLVSQALLLAGVESGRGLAERGTIQVSDLLSEAVERTRLVASETAGEDRRASKFLPEQESQPVNITLLRVDDQLYVQGDREALLRVLTNLLNNAVKFGATEVEVSAHRSKSNVTAMVADNGPGVAIDERDRIFEPYVRGSAVVAAGAGLGLHLARKITERHDGTLRLAGRSPGSTGATFELTLPLATQLFAGEAAGRTGKKPDPEDQS